MAFVKPSFPNSVWDGPTANSERESVNADCDPNT
jgi:hypothetical protein